MDCCKFGSAGGGPVGEGVLAGEGANPPFGMAGELVPELKLLLLVLFPPRE
jgi:hypothetical protein